MPRHPKSDIERAMAQMPGGVFVLTAACDGHAGAVLVKWVQPCSENPAMVMVALSRGQHIEPLLRNSRSFVLCQISESDRFLLRKFTQPAAEGERDDDPLVSIMTTVAPSGAPIVDRAMTYLDCEIIRHIELESDYRIYVGHVHAGAVLNQGAPAIQFGGNGSTPAH
jgi:flavin reductase (DIM6/NTAB) family NADH-FMN oxidoreductase RutF